MEKSLPQCIEAEQFVLGALMVNPMRITDVISIIKPDYFYKQSHKEIYSAILELFNKDEPVEIVSVSQHLKVKDKLEKVGGCVYINDLVLDIVSTAQIEYYAKLIFEDYRKREIIKSLTIITEEAYKDNKADDLLSMADNQLFKISSNNNTGSLEKINSFSSELWDEVENNYTKKQDVSGVPSGFNDIDFATGGFQPSDLIIIAARPSMGKTAFMLNITSVASKKTSIGIFSLEMNRNQLAQRLITSEAELDSKKCKTGHMSEKDWKDFAKFFGEITDRNIYIDDTGGLTVSEIRARSKKLKTEQPGLGLIIIDYLQLIGSEGKDKFNRENEVSIISKGLKNIAKELKIPVIALSQLSRACEGRQDKRPKLSDLRDSGSIEQDADVVMFIYRDEYYEETLVNKGKAEIIISKQRNGPIGTINLLWRPEYTKFVNPRRL